MLPRALLFLTLLAGCGSKAMCPFLSECDCVTTPECRVVAEPCYCGAHCLAGVACACGGGKYQRCEAR